MPRGKLVSLIIGFTLALGLTAQARAAATPTVYRLEPGSTFQQGCFPPCLCPILQTVDLRGTFNLTPAGFDGLFSAYDVTDVNWIVSLGDSALRITGAGTYRVGGEFARQHRLELDLKVGEDPAQHFDSGLVPGGSGFPRIQITISMNGQYCHDRVFVVNAAPQATTAQLEIIPPHPTPADDVSIRLFGTWPDSCVPRDAKVSIADREVHIDTFHPSRTCLMFLTPWSLTASIGQLSADTYQAIATYSQAGGPPREIGRERFTVAALFTGSDETGNFQRALEDAIRKAESAVPCCDRPITYQVVNIRGQAGGFAGLNRIEVTIQASWE
jgi:hypothetical protein